MASLNHPQVRPADLCKALLAALEAADGRRRSRKRDQTPDMIGITLKRKLLEQALREDPDPEAFEGWLLTSIENYPGPQGAATAMARSIFDEWRLAHSMPEFKAWLEQGAPSEDSNTGPSLSASRIEEPPLRQPSSPPSSDAGVLRNAPERTIAARIRRR